ncbi:hypothetical protein [Staphylococcus epidermidis]
MICIDSPNNNPRKILYPIIKISMIMAHPNHTKWIVEIITIQMYD